MPSIPTAIRSLRWLISAWAVIWLTVVPLFHTHLPDLSDESGQRQGGVAHTVFSADLPGEFSPFSISARHDSAAHLSKRVANSRELDFVLSTEDTKKDMGVRELGPSLCSNVLNRCLQAPAPLGHADARLLSHACPGLRAPPSALPA